MICHSPAHATRWGRTACLSAGLVLFLCVLLPAQDTPPAEEAKPAGVRLLQARQRQQQLASIDTALAQSDWPTAVRLWIDLSTRTEPTWSPWENRWLGEQKVLLLHLDRFPAAAYVLYETQATAIAQGLADIDQPINLEIWQRTAEQFPRTRYAAQLWDRLASWAWDRGQWQQAALFAERAEEEHTALARGATARPTPQRLALWGRLVLAWQRAGDAIRARFWSQQLADHVRQFPLDQTAGWFAAWQTADAELQAALKPSIDQQAWFPAADIRWDTGSLLPDEQSREVLLESHAEYVGAGFWPITAAAPQVVDSHVLFRTPWGLACREVTTGQEVWHQQGLSSPAALSSATNVLQNPEFRRIVGDQWLLRQMGDTLGTAYVVAGDVIWTLAENDPTQSGAPSPTRVVGAPTATSQNWLVALDRQTGKIRWHSHSLSAWKKAFFLSPPLVDGSQLYVLGQIESDLVLFCLDTRQFRSNWKLRLAAVPEGVQNDPFRRHNAARLVRDGRHLICLTQAGAFLSVDLLGPRFDWGVTYPSSATRPPPVTPFAINLESVKPLVLHEGWQRTAAFIASGKLIAASTDSPELWALQPETGTILWRQTPERPLFIGGVWNEHLLIVTRNAVEGRRLDTGEVAWRQSIASPSGCGVQQAGRYLLPLSDGGVWDFEIATGEVLRGRHSSGHELGNLAAGAGMIVAQSTTGLRAYADWSTVQTQLQDQRDAHPDDTQLQLQAVQQALRIGDNALAISELQSLSKMGPEIETQEIWLRAVVADVAAHPEAAARWQAILQQLARIEWHRLSESVLLAQGLEQAGDFQASLAVLQQAAIRFPASENWLTADEERVVIRSDRWLQGAVWDVLQRAAADRRAGLRAQFEEQLTAAQDSRDPFSLQRFADQWSELPWGEEVRLRQSQQANLGRPWFRRELSLQGLIRRHEPPLAAAALATWAADLADRSFRNEAALFYRRLRDEFAEVPVQGSRTGSQVVADISSLSLLSRINERRTDPWPGGRPLSSKSKQSSTLSVQTPIPLHAEPGSLGSRLQLGLDNLSQRVWCQGEITTGFWDVPLPPTRTQAAYRNHGPLHRGWIFGHFAVLQLGTELHGVTLLDSTGDPRGRAQWQVDLVSPQTNALLVGQDEPFAPGWGRPRPRFIDQYQQPVGQVPIVLPQYFAYRLRNELIVCDTGTGQPLWRRRGLSPQTVVTGNAEFVWLLDPAQKQVTQCRSWDGRPVTLQSCPFPPEEVRLWRGSEGLRIASQPEGWLVQNWDLTSLQPRWEQRWDPAVTLFPLDDNRLAALDAAGRLEIRSIADGQLRGEVTIPRPAQITGLWTWNDVWRDYVLISGPLSNPQVLDIKLPRHGPRREWVNGVFVALDRETGNKVWSRELGDQAFPIDQHGGAPCFVLTSRTQPDRQNPASGETTLQVVDRRSGETVYEERDPLLPIDWAVEANVEDGWVDLHSPTHRIRLDYSAAGN